MIDKQTSLTVNGKSYLGQPRPGLSLLGFLRNDLGLTGSKVGCASGDCGACTVLLDGVAVQSCQVTLAAADGVDVQTIEALIMGEIGGQVASALIQEDAAQCGYCLPGIVVAATGAFSRGKADTPIEEALAGNICRCGTHSRILRALRRVQSDLSEGKP